MKNNPFEAVLLNENFSDKEQRAFIEIIQYAKSCRQNGRETLKEIINAKVEEVIKWSF